VTAEQTFERVVATLATEPGVTLGKAFHNPGLKLGTKLFVMLHADAREALSFGRELAA
jgi:hypothetical protein